MINRIIFVLSLLGIIVSSYLAYEYTQSSSIVCPISGIGCNVVRSSPYASFFGISTPFYGVAFYFLMAMLSVIRGTLKGALSNYVVWLQVILSSAAFIFGVYLTYLEAFIIRAFCSWCLASFAITASIMLLSILRVRANLSWQAEEIA